MSKVSVIIAAFNIEKYISAAIASAASQTMKEIEILVVDDGSTDGTLRIAEQYAAIDGRVKLLRHDTAKGLLQAWKTGVNAAAGEAILFLNGDTALVPKACETAYSEFKELRSDMIQFQTELLFEDPQRKDPKREALMKETLFSVPHRVVSISPFGLLEAAETKGAVSFALCNKLYKADVCKKAAAHLPKDHISEYADLLLGYLLQFFSKSYSHLEDSLCEMTIRREATAGRPLSDARMTALAEGGAVYTFLKQWTMAQKAEERCKKGLERVLSQSFLQIGKTLFEVLPKWQKNVFFEEVRKTCSDEDLVLGLSQYLYREGPTSAVKYAKDLAGLDFFASKKQQAKTIGVFYFRMFNGGVENVISSLSDIWVKHGYNVVLFTDKKPNKKDYYINPAVKRVILPEMVDTALDTRSRRITEFRKALIENEVDALVYNAWVNPHLLLDEMIIKSCGVNLIIHTHNLFCCETDSGNPWVAHLYASLNQTYALADSLVTLTDIDTAWWSALGMKAFKTINPIQLPLSVAPSELNGNNVLLVARLNWEKNIIDALKIMQEVHKKVPSATLTVLGTGDDLDYIKQIEDHIADNQMEQYINMAGFDTNVFPYYQRSDILLSTAKFEGFGLALMESKICGMPMVCYELPNLDITKEAKGMRVIEQNDIDGAANAIVEILQNEDLKRRLGKEARESATEYCSKDLAAHWDFIFAQSLLPKEPAVPAYLRSPLDAAVNIAVSYYSDGIFKRASSGADRAPQVMVDQEALRQLEQIGRSESYRVGLLVTYIPRKLKQLFTRKKRKAKR